MRVWLVNRYYRPDHSATAQILTDVAEGLAKRGMRVKVITSRQRIEDPDAALPRDESIAGVAIHRVRTPSFGRTRLVGRLLDYLGFYIGAAWTVLRRARRGDVVIAKTDPPLLGLALLPIASLRGVRLTNWLQDVYPEVAERLRVLSRARWLWRALARLRDISLKRAASNVVIGDAMKRYLEGRGIPAERLVCIPNFSPNLQHTARPAAADPLRAELGLGSSDVLIAYSGNLGRAHPIETWLQACRVLRDEARIHFVMIGGGAGRPRLEAAVREEQLPRWHFLQYQPRARLAELLGAADVHLVTLSPELEGLIVPSKIYGVLACARPCLFLGERNGEVGKLLAQWGCGASATDGDAAAHYLRQWAGDATLREQMGACARRAYETRFTPEHILVQWSEWLQPLATPRASEELRQNQS